MMSSLLKLHVAGAFFLLSALHHLCSVHGASLRQPKVHGGEEEVSRAGPYRVPNTDMVKALEYIESLRQQTRGDEGPAAEYDDLDRFHSLPFSAAVPKPEDVSQDEAGGWQDERSQQWLKVLLKTLRQAGKEPKAMSAPSGTRQAYSNRLPLEDDADDGGEYEGGPWSGRQKLPKKYPLMFEDEDSRESPYKRTNENVEEQYTPQSLATLQSVFEELGKLSSPKASKRHSIDREMKFYRGDDDDDDDDIYRVNNMAYEDVTGGEDWTPVEEKVETEEEVKGSREEFDRGSDENDGSTLKRSSLSGKLDEKEEPDDFTKLVDYYLLKILEKSEQTENKRDRTEEQSPPLYSINPQAIYQLIDISRKLQVPPEDLIDMLKNGEIKIQEKMLEPEEDIELQDDLDRAEEISSSSKDRSPNDKLYSRKKAEMLPNDIPEDLNTEDILNILGLDSLNNQKGKYLLKPKQNKNTPSRLYSPSGRRGDLIISEPSSISDNRKSSYDDTFDEGELASQLAAKMLAQYPKVLKEMDLKRAVYPSSKEQQLALETLMQDYFDQMASDNGPPSKRVSETEDAGDSTQMRLDDDMLLKILGQMKPETGGNEERDLYGKAVSGM